jgi:hypothetical protein
MYDTSQKIDFVSKFSDALRQLTQDLDDDILYSEYTVVLHAELYELCNIGAKDHCVMTRF